MQHELPPASQREGVQTVEISFKSAAAAAAVGAARHAPRDRRGQTACDPLALFVAWYGSARALRPELHAARRHATAGEACPTGDKTVSKSNCRKVDLRCGNKNGSLKLSRKNDKERTFEGPKRQGTQASNIKILWEFSK